MGDRGLIEELDRQLEYEELHAPLEAAIMAIRNRLANPPALAGPMEREGWVLVPAAPDTAWLTTIEAAASAQWGDTDANHHRAHRIRAAMLSAAPKP